MYRNIHCIHLALTELGSISKLSDTIKLFGIELLHVISQPHRVMLGIRPKKMFGKREGIIYSDGTHYSMYRYTLVGKHLFNRPAVNFSINQSEY